MEIYEYRRCEGLVAAEIIKDDSDAYTTGEPFEVAGLANVSRTTEVSVETGFYDNKPATTRRGNAADTVTFDVSAIPLDVFAKLTGYKYDSELEMLIEGEPEMKYFAVGYKTGATNGDEMYVWRLKGSFNIPDQENHTDDDSTDANGQQLIFTGLSTTHKFAKDGKSAKSITVNATRDKVQNLDKFFDAVQTPDTVSKKSLAG